MKFQIALYYRSNLTRLNTLSLEDLGYYFALWAMLCQLGTENWIMIYLRPMQECNNMGRKQFVRSVSYPSKSMKF